MDSDRIRTAEVGFRLGCKGALRARTFIILLLCIVAVGGPIGVASAQPAASQPAATSAPATQAPDDGPRYKVTEFQLAYGRPHPDLPALSKVKEQQVSLGVKPDGYVAPRPGLAIIRVQIGDVPVMASPYFYASAIQAIDSAIVAYYNKVGLIGIYVAPDDTQIRLEDSKDLRPAGQTTLRLMVWAATVSQVRTLASGQRVPMEQRIDNPAHARIRQNSPLQGAPADGQGTKDLLRKDLLDDYIFRLNRQPGRRVDAAISPANTTGDVALDYLVTETKPWLVYAQVSNTGTKATGDWRERFGFIDNQLTGHDDILTLDYITTCFKDTQAAAGSYEAPFFNLDRLRWGVHANWNQFTASDVGLANEQFLGSSWKIGGQLIPNIFQHRELFLDAILGVDWEHVYVEDKTINTEGSSDFFMPSIGLRLERNTRVASTYALVDLSWNCSGVAGTEDEDATKLGRLDPDTSFAVTHWDMSQSFFLEPLLHSGTWDKPGQESTLAHEMALRFRGQYAWRHRLVPELEDVAGGLYTVPRVSGVHRRRRHRDDRQRRVHVPRPPGLQGPAGSG